MGYLKDTIKGVSWMGALRASTRVIAFIKLAVLARILLPAQFGLFGIAALILSFLETMTLTGINVFFIQGEGKIKEYIDSAWVISILRGSFISLIILLSAPLISNFFNSPEARNIIVLISMVPLIRGFINPAIIRYQKELVFNKEFILRFILFSVDSLVAIIVAFVTKSAEGLVWGLSAGASLEVVVSFLIFKPKPKFALQIEKVKKIVGRGKWVTASGVFDYLFTNGDDVVVGKLIDTTALGLYQVAYKISTLPITEISQVVGKVVFPVYSKISGDKERLKKAYFKTVLAISALAIPVGLILFFLTKEIVLIILGKDWLQIVPAVKVLSIFGVFGAIFSSSNALFMSVKKQEYVAVITFVSILGMAVSIIPLVMRLGLVGAGYSALIGSVLSLPFIVFYLRRVFN